MKNYRLNDEQKEQQKQQASNISRDELIEVIFMEYKQPTEASLFFGVMESMLLQLL